MELDVGGLAQPIDGQKHRQLAVSVSEAGQPAELGWGFPREPGRPSLAITRSVQITQSTSSAPVPVKTWPPNGGPCTGLLITHDEAISLPDFLTAEDGNVPLYRPTVH
ncbi:hypothetical protein [Phytopseudomonas flavescens]|uniref:hypothetical protein n=1 Tax=Phytopseudomonas flavescens TaxID=29435 RepID=UPI000A0726A8|nr:hypothetical protein [Pseudomonas flavescens]